MEWGIPSLGELEKMKQEMDRVWNDLFEEDPKRNGDDAWQWVEKLPKFEGAGKRKSFKSRSNKTIKSL
jgi:hypothetical protein